MKFAIQPDQMLAGMQEAQYLWEDLGGRVAECFVRLI